jgi:hypothetical protein
MAERKQVDWESVERDYSAGLLSLREIAAKYGVSPSLITRKKNEGEWPKDLTSKIQAKADSIITGVNTGGVNTGVNSKKASEKEVIEVNAQAIVNVKLKHRSSIGRLNSVVDSLLAEIEVLNKDKSVDNLPMRVDLTKKLSDTLKTSIDKERQAFGIVDVPTPTENAITELVKVCQGNSVSITTSANDFDDDDE